MRITFNLEIHLLYLAALPLIPIEGVEDAFSELVDTIVFPNEAEEVIRSVSKGSGMSRMRRLNRRALR